MITFIVQPSLCLINCHAVKPCAGGWSISHHIHLGTRKTTVVTFLAQPLHTKYHINMKLGGPQKLPGCCADHKNLLPCQNMNHSSLFSSTQPTCHNEWPIPAPFRSVCHSMYSTAHCEIVAQWANFSTVLGTFNKQSQKTHTSSLFSAWLIQSANAHFIKIHVNITLLFTNGLSMWDLRFSFSGQNSVLISDISHDSYMPSPSLSSLFCNHEISCWAVHMIT